MATKGILGTKLGMTQVFDSDSRVIPVTVVQAGPCTVTQVRTVERDGYLAVQLAYGARRRTTKPVAGHLAKAGVASARTLVEIRLDDAPDPMPELGAVLTCETFAKGEIVDATGTSKGKGYAGVMKRHNFHGMGDGHGVKKKNRHPGAVGNASTPGRTFRGMKMAGRMGGERVTVQGLEVAEVDTEHGLILVRGALPGSNGSVVLLRDAVKAPTPDFTWPTRDGAAPADDEAAGEAANDDEPVPAAATTGGTDDEEGQADG